MELLTVLILLIHITLATVAVTWSTGREKIYLTVNLR